jgi:hypothetical protein
MMFSSNTCRFVVCFLSMSLSATAETVRGVHRELLVEDTELLEDTVELGTAGDYAILTKTGISTVPDSTITGDIAVSPAAVTYMTGFGFSSDAANKFSTSPQIVGKAFGANHLGNTPTLLTTAIGFMETAYTDAAGRTKATGDRLDLGAGVLGGALFGSATAPLTPGVYTFGKGVSIGADITFDGKDDPDAIFIIQMMGNLIQAGGTRVNLAGSAKAENIFWQVAGRVEVGKGAHMEGIILVKTAVLFETGSSLKGRILTQTFCALQKATITEP